MRFKQVLLSFLLATAMLFLLEGRLFAQKEIDPEKQNLLEQLLEIIIETAEEDDIDFTTLFDDLAYYYDYPINLNDFKREDLEALQFLTVFQINNIITYKDKNKKFYSLYELTTIPGLEYRTIRILLPFITLEDVPRDKKTPLKEMLSKGRNDMFLRWQRVLEEQVGYSSIDPEELAANPNRRYLGSPDRLYLRYRYTYRNKLSIGFVGEKDPGEEFFRGSQRQGFDFNSAHIFFRDVGRFKQIAIGDFQAQFGQGLTYWTGLGFQKSPFSISLKKNAVGLRPYNSANENLFLRGAGFAVQEGRFTLTLFGSRRNLDATLIEAQLAADTLDNDLGGVQFDGFSSFNLTGFHRTPRELRNRGSVLETTMGGNLEYANRKNLKIGFTAVETNYNLDFQRRPQLHNQFEFSASRNFVMGMDYDYIYKNVNFFGEVSRSDNGGMAILNTALIELDSRFKLAILHRRYDKDYQAIYTRAFGDNARNINEEGIYLGVEFLPFKYVTVNAYFDNFRYPWLRFRADAPFSAYDYLTQVNYRPSSRWDAYFRYRTRTRPRNDFRAVGERTNTVVAASNTNYRFHINYNPTKQLRFSNRYEIVEFQVGNNDREMGYLLFQDVTWLAKKKPLSISMRYAIFSTESFDSRFFAFEKNALYVYSIPAYFGNGSRAYCLFKYSVGRKVDIWFRVAQTWFRDRDQIGTGLEQINGNQRTDAVAQVRIKF
ncbi:MAG: hypothetical protein ACXITV_11355 [Luteibaculaceae bacterium]